MIYPNEHIQKELISICKSGKLQSLNIYNVNEYYFELNGKTQYIINGGIELHFPKGIICIGWSSDEDAFVFHIGKFETVYKRDNFVLLEQENGNHPQSLVGLDVQEVAFRTMDFDYVYDYTMQTKSEKLYVEMILKFGNNLLLQISLINYELQVDKAPANYSYDVSTELMLSVNNLIEIRT